MCGNSETLYTAKAVTMQYKLFCFAAPFPSQPPVIRYLFRSHKTVLYENGCLLIPKCLQIQKHDINEMI